MPIAIAGEWLASAIGIGIGREKGRRRFIVARCTISMQAPETPMPQPMPRFITQPLANAAAWVPECPIDSVPVLARTTYEIEDWLEFAEQLDLHTLAGTVEDDPLMTLKLHAFLGRRLDREVDSEPDTVVGSLLINIT